jgi:hypothetical protein
MGQAPEQERGKNRGFRNLMFWWIVIISGSITLFIAFG